MFSVFVQVFVMVAALGYPIDTNYDSKTIPIHDDQKINAPTCGEWDGEKCQNT